ncbi:Fibroblast growth factor receptor 2 [Exaiptasia diaphana]|nr:Fibroblast growth factor receptor 2 [Exaiptasia diaphana]
MELREVTALILLMSFITMITSSKEPPYLLQHRKMRGSFIAWPALHSIKLRCKANGSAPLQFRWLKDGKPIVNRRLQPLLKTDQWFLRIRDLVPSDTGDYTCIVWNPYGKVNHTYTLHVVSKARSRPILNCGYPKNTTTLRHSNVRLKCVVALSGSLPDFRWIHWKTAPLNLEKPLDLKNGHFTVIDPIHYSTIDIGNKGQHGVVLNLKNVTNKDFGLYTCIASNHLGRDYRSAYLIKKERKRHNVATVTPKDIKTTTETAIRHKTTDRPSKGAGAEANNVKLSSSSSNESPEPQVPLSTFIGTVAGVVFLLAAFTLWFHYHHKRKEIINEAVLIETV